MPFYFLLIYRKWLIFAIYAKSFWVFREKLQLRYEIRAFADRVNEVENSARAGKKVWETRDSIDFRGLCDSCNVGLTPEDSIALADIMGRFMETERLILWESRE